MSRPYSTFDVTLAAREQISSSFVRITLVGHDLGHCSPTLLDQRVKLLFGSDESLDLMLSSGDDWYAALLAAGEKAPRLRTYTLISVTAHDDGYGSVQIDVALHPLSAEDDAPGMRFATSAPLGSRTLLVAGDRRVEGHDRVGLAWRTNLADEVLLVGDETALPAVLNIVSTLPAHTVGRVVLEVPHADDVREVIAPPRVTLDWRVRERGERAVGVFAGTTGVLDEKADPDELVWDEVSATTGRQAWIAGEAGWVRGLRAEAKAAGVSKDEVSFMGYWKRGLPGS